ncbi:MAG: hypothetical protein J0M10_00555 [Chitinophagales bacterium]|nr:hypothetical protein [Chitinophagales bacterium]
MKKIIVTCLALFTTGLFMNASAQQSYTTAVGVRLSSSNAMVNNAVSVKHFIKPNIAIEGLLSFGDPLALGALLELHQPLNAQGLSWYYGGGAYIGFLKTVNTTTLKTTTDPNFGAQGVVGLDYKFNNIPLNLSLDWKPELNIVTDINFEPAAIGLTARFTFGK